MDKPMIMDARDVCDNRRWHVSIGYGARSLGFEFQNYHLEKAGKQRFFIRIMLIWKHIGIHWGGDKN